MNAIRAHVPRCVQQHRSSGRAGRRCQKGRRLRTFSCFRRKQERIPMHRSCVRAIESSCVHNKASGGGLRRLAGKQRRVVREVAFVFLPLLREGYSAIRGAENYFRTRMKSSRRSEGPAYSHHVPPPSQARATIKHKKQCGLPRSCAIRFRALRRKECTTTTTTMVFSNVTFC